MENNSNARKLLENKIYTIVKEVLREFESIKNEKSVKSKRYDDNEETKRAYKRQYKEVENYLNRPEIDATQVMSKALGFNADDDAARSHAFKKLHRDKTPDKSGVYKFTPDEIIKIHSLID